ELTDLLETAADDPDRHQDLVQRCTHMLELLEAHNSKEEPIIYTRADADLPAEARTQLQEFLRRGSTPAGWVCERAGGLTGRLDRRSGPLLGAPVDAQVVAVQLVDPRHLHPVLAGCSEHVGDDRVGEL